MQEWTMRHHVARVDNAGVDKSARCGKGGHCRSGQCGTTWQGWTMREWTMQEWSNVLENVLKTSCKSPTVCEITTHSSRFHIRLNSLCAPPDCRSVQGKHDGDKLERLRYDSERPQMQICIRKSLVKRCSLTRLRHLFYK